MKENHFSWFTYSGRETRGLLVLLTLITGIYFTPDFYVAIFPPPEPNLEPFIQQIMRYRKTAHIEKSDLVTGYQESAALFEFDPNLLDEAGWIKLGLSPKQATGITRYRAKGGRFRKPEDLSRMYTITPERYRKLLPFIRIRDPHALKLNKGTDSFNHGQSARQFQVREIIAINTADSIQLDRLRGIGPAFAARIIRYRERLGGFVNRSQLLEVYGMDSVRYSQLASQITVDSLNIRKISINSVGFEDLKSHPYLKYLHVNAILRYRAQHGRFSSIADLAKVLVLNGEIIRKIEPYLVFHP